MSSRWFAAALTLVLLVAALPARSQTAAPPGMTEPQTLQSLLKLFNDPTTQPSALDAAIDAFRQRFPHSQKMAGVLLLAVRYHDQRGEYLPELRYGMAALALAPHNLYLLSRLGRAIPQNVRSSDLNRDQMLAQASEYDQQVLTALKEFHITAAGMDFQGAHYTQQRAIQLRNTLGGPAYSSLGRIAGLRRQYTEAAAAFAQALPYQPAASQRALTYYQIAVADYSAHQIPQAKAALAQASALKPQSKMLLSLIQAENARIAEAAGK